MTSYNGNLLMLAFLITSNAIHAQQPGTLHNEYHSNTPYNYLTHLPAGYGEQGLKWPLIIFLHGTGERGIETGTDFSRLYLPNLVIKPEFLNEIYREDFNFIVVAPQIIDQSAIWMSSALKEVVDEVITTYLDIDRDRIYLTGCSLGGYGTWDFANNYPDLFAAIAPLCGAGIYQGQMFIDPTHFVDIPILAINGFDGIQIDHQATVEAVNAAGGNAQFIYYPDLGHDIGTLTYSKSRDIYDWFLQHSQSEITNWESY